MTIARFSPLGDVVSLREAMDRLFEDSVSRPKGGWSTVAAGQVVVPVDSADNITISGEFKPTTDMTSGWLRHERRIGKFARSFTVPVQIDPTKVEAKFTNGVLELVLPKAENVKPRTIKVNAFAK